MATVTLRMDDREKAELDAALDMIGMNISTFYSLYTKKFLHERKIPFEVSIPEDPFYSESNLAQIACAERQVAEGKVVVKTIEELEQMANEKGNRL